MDFLCIEILDMDKRKINNLEIFGFLISQYERTLSIGYNMDVVSNEFYLTDKRIERELRSLSIDWRKGVTEPTVWIQFVKCQSRD